MTTAAAPRLPRGAKRCDEGWYFEVPGLTHLRVLVTVDNDLVLVKLWNHRKFGQSHRAAVTRTMTVRRAGEIVEANDAARQWCDILARPSR